MKYLLSTFILFFLLHVSDMQAQALDSTQIKMIKALGPERIQSFLEKMVEKGSAGEKANFKKVLEIIKLEQPSIETVELKRKTVKFIPIAHAGQKKFYDSLTSMIKEYKSKGYVVFYEQLKSVRPNSEVDTIRLKYRKIVGVEPTRKMYSMLTLIFPNIVVQPEYNLLGITETDVNADITIADFVAQYEKIYGTVVLETCDYESKIGTMSTCKPLKKNLDAIILNYRNENLANMVKQSKNKKILVVYGANHIQSMMELIKRP